LTITNVGPATSGLLQATNSFAGANIVSIVCTNGTFTTNAGNIYWSLPALAAGEHAALSFSLNSSQTGAVTVTASAQPVSPDPVPQNNTAIAIIKVGPSDGLMSTALKFPARDLVWSPSAGRLLVAGGSAMANGDGALFSLDPQTLEIQWAAQLGVG